MKYLVNFNSETLSISLEMGEEKTGIINGKQFKVKAIEDGLEAPTTTHTGSGFLKIEDKWGTVYRVLCPIAKIK